MMLITRLGLITIAIAASALAQNNADAARLDHFEKRIRPVLASRCYPCHSKAAPATQGGLLLDSAAGIRKGGNAGALMLPGNPDRSLLIRAIRQQDKNLKMPPGDPLPAETVADFESWIRDGAALPADAKQDAPRKTALWSLRQPRPPASPNTMDGFIRERLASKGLAPSPEADRRTLIRRATFDLTGLPPSAAAVEHFLRDAAPGSYERLIDRLLASPRYGERYARHWLDVARYSDSVNDAVNAGQRFPWSYTYRDWVIHALNEDLPYDKFVLYQIAADRVPNVEARHLAALGFLSLGREFPKSFPETVDDRIDAVTRGFLGLTVACARCHDHKYDPIPAKDYYSLYSIFSNIRKPSQLPLLGTSGAVSPNQTTYQQRLVRIEKDYQDYRARRHAEMVAFFKSQAPEYQRAAKDSEHLSNPEIEELARDRQLNLHVLNRWRKAGGATPADVPLEEFEQVYTEGDSNNSRTLRNRYNTMLAQSAYDGAAARAMAVEDLPHPQPTHVFLRGNPNNPGALAPPRFLSCLGGEDTKPFLHGSGRLDLAHAIIDPANPLTARVIVNRIWMQHFGAGLVRTPSDFGLRGDPPTHPELLDFLAVQFIQSGWSLKKLHRLIMTSATYRQASSDNEAARRLDPENLLLWRMNRRRLEIESIRDSMLAAAGRLDLKQGGVPFLLTAQPAVPRRSVYGFIERGRVPALLNAFDFPPPDQHAPMRFVTTVPQQALFFLNSPFVTEIARHLAARPELASAATAAPKIQLLYSFVYSRPAADWEVEAGLKFLSRATEAATAEAAASPWRYGVGQPEAFIPFPKFDVDRWLGGASLPAAQFGKAVLRAASGEPGDNPGQAVIRRWVSPIAGKLNIEGVLRHAQPAVPFGDGVRARIVSSRLGELASWSVNGSGAETRLSGIAVEKGDTIDCIVDARLDPENDAFTWAPVIKSGGQSWSAKDDFAGPAPKPLTVWERYAQVLLEANEFAFVD
ncbi:MAG: PSD1 domain-containing protein [Acidobacteriia bacterium]|nr:PSD1 domain-containing protein [Terriglobia bacterium]